MNGYIYDAQGGKKELYFVTLEQCRIACMEETDFECRSIAFKDYWYGTECHLREQDYTSDRVFQLHKWHPLLFLYQGRMAETPGSFV